MDSFPRSSWGSGTPCPPCRRLAEDGARSGSSPSFHSRRIRFLGYPGRSFGAGLANLKTVGTYVVWTPCCRFQEHRPWEATPPNQLEQNTNGGQAEGTAGTSSLKDRVLKMSTLVDQADESEPNPATRDQVDEWVNACVTIMGSSPAEEEEPSEAQLAALHRRTWVLKRAPYTDFAIWTPFGRKCLKAQKFCTTPRPCRKIGIQTDHG